MTKVKIINKDLESWVNLNAALNLASETYSQSLLKEELAGRCRKQFLLRIHSRINKLRADRERDELRKRAK
jgi:hypothetical protein